MVSINISHTFPVSTERAFTYITNLRNWPEYWPDFIRLEEVGDIKWGTEGARVRVVIKLLGRETRMDIELHQFTTNQEVEYVSRQKGLPVIRHERHFEEVPDGCCFRLKMEYEPRCGVITGLFDRYLLKSSIINAVRKTLGNLQSELG